ncbi:hypothetical protein Pcinc_009917 [Petrolisthes cinctipes]|uniref:Uncharacterized protein n=1 Tax=Petrolisthes cinctipes TaxID=88211 RepID=A0AAE1G3S6_PETCI|nr:hypothetical protein Pcinc_009917 [Petrolisthes cinctipes]
MTSLGATGAGELGISPGTVLPGRSVHGVRPTMIPRRVLSGVNHHVLLPLPLSLHLLKIRLDGSVHDAFSQGLTCGMDVLDVRSRLVSLLLLRLHHHHHHLPSLLLLPTLPHLQTWPSRKSVATLMARYTALENRFSALEARIDGLVAAQAANYSKLSTLVEAQQAIISTVTTLTEKMDTVASRLEKLFESVPSPGPSSSPGRSSAPTHQTSTSKYRVR